MSAKVTTLRCKDKKGHKIDSTFKRISIQIGFFQRQRFLFVFPLSFFVLLLWAAVSTRTMPGKIQGESVHLSIRSSVHLSICLSLSSSLRGCSSQPIRTDGWADGR